MGINMPMGIFFGNKFIAKFSLLLVSNHIP